MSLDDRLCNIEEALENFREYRTSIEDLETDVMYLKEKIEKLEDMQSAMLTMPNVVWTKYRKSPHRCPVCNGFASPSISEHTAPGPRAHYRETDRCHSCEGKGFIWD